MVCITFLKCRFTDYFVSFLFLFSIAAFCSRLWFGEKCLLINLMNILSIMVLPDLLYGGLNQIMLCFLFSLFWLFSFGCWHCSLVYIHYFLRVFHSKWLTPEKYFLMMKKLRVIFQLIVEFLQWLMAGALKWREYIWFLRWVFCKGGI